ncbi:MAG: VIT1/CCC1 transporter family protein [Acidobacteria bacterium]|nr:VIT1/CCC1 transporter family protein [Acidobacteriota bacterium]MCA1651683.1 VIT1/CCC1 transporter family protein [Acidobacteriota bacterium]
MTTAEERPVADETWDEHYRDERDASYLYGALAAIEPDQERRELFQRLAVVEDRHVARWRELFHESGRPLPAYRTAARTRLLAWIARRFGTNLVLPLMLAEEGREVQAYLGLARHSTNQSTHLAAIEIASDSAVHARELSEAMGREGEPWHVGGAGGYLRSVVYGFNDGLTANFGLVAGIIGANVAPHVVIITGVAGALADALSMGSSGYLAAKSEAEVQAHQIEMERHEMRLMPDLEEEELAVIYEAKGLTRERARETAKAMMLDPAQALDAMVREELNIHPADLAPLKDGLVTGLATAVGACIPIAPFFVFDYWQAVWVSLAISMLAHFAIGAARSLLTGRGVWASGRDMFIVGFGVAAVGYVIGELISRS